MGPLGFSVDSLMELAGKCTDGNLIWLQAQFVESTLVMHIFWCWRVGEYPEIGGELVDVY